jgi:V/A-type H+-transporting ATPase subunit A
LNEPLITGKRLIDLLFPISKGGSAIIPGGFGTGKTILQQSLARWASVDIVVYVGCGERGNEIAEVLSELPKIEDRRSGSTLIERTIIIANTSNMPVAAREASIYLGVTIAEYYRDMGYDVLMLADSTSRWGEALREVSSRLEEIPGEEGYPAYLSSRLSEFYERAGHVLCQGSGRIDGDKECDGSISIIGAVSPPGGDFSDPITQSSMRVTGVFWALDYELSRRRHFPAINWTKSFSLVDLSAWFIENVADDFPSIVRESSAILRREDELLQIVQLVGQDALSELERELLMIARIIREDFLQQIAIREEDSFCPIEKSYWMLKVILNLHHRSHDLIQQGISLDQISNLSCIQEIARMKNYKLDTAVEKIKEVQNAVNLQCSLLQRQGEVNNDN